MVRRQEPRPHKAPRKRQKPFKGLTDTQWTTIQAALDRTPHGARALWLSTRDPRATIDAILDAAWEGRWPAPEGASRWVDVASCAHRWTRFGILPLIFRALADDPDFPFSLCEHTLIVADDPRHSRNRRFLGVHLAVTGKNNKSGISRALNKRLHTYRQDGPALQVLEAPEEG